MTHHEFVNAVAQEFELAFLTTGLKPVRRNWGDGVDSGCMVTALDVGEHGAAVKPVSFFDEALPMERVSRVVKHLSAKFPQFGQPWWEIFVSYCVLAYDGCATFPRRWLQRNTDACVGPCTSAKLLGATVGGQVYKNVCAAPIAEKVVEHHHSHEQPVCEQADELVAAR